MFYRENESDINKIEINEEKKSNFLLIKVLFFLLLILPLLIFSFLLITPKIFRCFKEIHSVKEIYDKIEKEIDINGCLVKIEGVIIYLTRLSEKENFSGYIYNNGYIIQIENLPEGFEENDRIFIEGNVTKINFPFIFVEKARKIRSGENISVEEIKIGKIPPKGKLVKINEIKVEINDVMRSYGHYVFNLTLSNFNGYYVAKTEEDANRVMELNNSYVNVTFALILIDSRSIARVFQIF